ncbi:neuropeptide FF receptor 2 [Octopus bimaculoides]|uniref:G-protein coupled receptors family 1 profile domain-containing protein n=1 Tax=Octopus bimaculoides TaxID=37653 RepID=A0A0L8H275_OCTBM|nr:neuropeptide FF receptor 2 [Octopus bimaculoides]|eukprot:XP_014776024.1 PREDICTED: neuropeptide FF receptor 2-like [Octopus bimaculoides]
MEYTGSPVVTAVNITLERLNDEKALLRIPAIIYTIILMVIGLFGNTITCYIYGYRLKMLPTHCFIIVLAVFDILSCCIAMPTEILDMRYPFMFPSMIACKILRFLSYFTTGSSSIILLIIAVDRYKRVCRPFKRQISVREAKIIAVVISVIGIGVTSPMLYISGKMTHPTRIPYINGTDCSISDNVRNTKFPKIYFGILFLIIISSFVAMSICYLLLWLEVKNRCSNPIGSNRTTSNAPIEMPNSPQALTDERSNSKTLNRTNLTVFLVTLLFILSYIPCLSLQVARTIIQYELNMNHVTELFYCIGMRSYFLSNSLNPIIYGYCNRQFGDEFKRLFSRYKEVSRNLKNGRVSKNSDSSSSSGKLQTTTCECSS